MPRFIPILIVLTCMFMESCRFGYEVRLDAGQDAGLDAGLDAGADDGNDTSGPYPDPFVDQAWFGEVVFEPGELLTALNASGKEGEPYLSHDGLTLFFASDRAGSFDVYQSTRASLDVTFSQAPVPVAWINTDAGESRYARRFDGLEVIAAIERDDGLGESDLWRFMRTDTGVPFDLASAELMEDLSTAGDEWDPYLSRDGLRLYFASTGRPEGPGGGGDLYVAERSDLQKPFGSPLQLSVNSEYAEGNPSLSGDERVVVFNSNRPDGAGGSDIYYAVRQNYTDDFEAPILVGGINSDLSEIEPFLRHDTRELFYGVITVDGDSWELYRTLLVTE